jgi:hypothetical protein
LQQHYVIGVVLGGQAKYVLVDLLSDVRHQDESRPTPRACRYGQSETGPVAPVLAAVEQDRYTRRAKADAGALIAAQSNRLIAESLELSASFPLATVGGHISAERLPVSSKLWLYRRGYDFCEVLLGFKRRLFHACAHSLSKLTALLVPARNKSL